MKRSTAIFALCCIFAVAGPAAAQVQVPPPQNVLNLSASASVEVVRDLLSVTFSTTQEAREAAAVQSALTQALDAALAEARRIARPGQVDVQAGQLTVHPQYDPKGGGIRGWMGTVEMTVEGRDMDAIAQLAGRISTMTVARLGYGLSREKRQSVEADVTAEAIARYRAKAGAIARQFGFEGYTIREVHVGTDEPPPRAVAMMARAAGAAQEALPVEPGRGTVTATVTGSVQMQPK